MLDEGGKDAALSDKKKRVWIHKSFISRKSQGEYWTLYKVYGYVPRRNWDVTDSQKRPLSAGKDHLEPTEEEVGF
jgi:hypothetical protein